MLANLAARFHSKERRVFETQTINSSGDVPGVVELLHDNCQTD